MKRFILVVISCIFVVALTGWYGFVQMDSGLKGEQKGEMEQQRMKMNEGMMKQMMEKCMVVMFLGATPLLAQSFEGNDYEKGKTLYRNKCRFCHGIRGDGKGPASEPLLGHPVDFTNSKFWQEDVEKKIEDTIKKGKEMMAAFDLEPGEIKAIVWYMSHTFKKAAQNNNSGMDEK